jgi:sugar lactone lactonase YvrE
MTVVHPPETGESAVASPPGVPRPDVGGELPEVLFREARRRERRRRLAGLAIVLIVLGGAGAGYALSSGGRSPGTNRSGSSPENASQPTVPTAVGAQLRQPYRLTVAPDGDLYIVDVARDQVLRRLPSGRFQVVAGDGRRGFAGDGGPATSAELNLEAVSGIAVAKDGTLYVADSGNDRVRAVSADGTIGTVAGDGRSGSGDGLILRTTPALDASFGPPSGLAIGPTGDLYIATGNVLRLTPSGTIEWVAGKRAAFACVNGIYCNPAGEADFTYPDQLAFDRAGDLFVAGDNGPSLYEIAADGRLAYLGQFRGEGGGRAGALAEAPDGSVVEAGTLGLARLPANGEIRVPKPLLAPQLPAAPGEAIRGNLDHALGRNKGLVGGYNAFVGGDGVAAGPGGVVYADANTDIVSSVAALVEVEPGGRVLTLWRS